MFCIPKKMGGWEGAYLSFLYDFQSVLTIRTVQNAEFLSDAADDNGDLDDYDYNNNDGKDNHKEDNLKGKMTRTMKTKTSLHNKYVNVPVILYILYTSNNLRFKDVLVHMILLSHTGRFSDILYS